VCIRYQTIIPNTNEITYCDGDSEQIALSGGVTYQWSPSAGLSNPNISKPIIAATDSIIYTVTVTDQCGLNWVDTIVVNVAPEPVVNFPEDTVLCETESINLGLPNAANYAWNTGATGSNITVLAPNSGVYWGRAINGSCSDADTIEIQFDAILDELLNPDTIICLGDTVSLPNPLPNDGASYYVFFTNAQDDDQNPNSPDLMFFSASNSCGLVSDTQYISYAPTLFVQLPQDSTFCSDVVVPLRAIENNPQFYTYNWSSGDTTNNVVFSESGVYSVTVTSPCEVVSDDITLTAENCNLDIEVPNVFTPNGDGVNDFFVVPVTGDGPFDVKVFNRWGQMLYESDSSNYSPWDGRNEAENEVPEGTYFYIVEYPPLDKTYTGNITLMR